jgi:hypothetical protein
MTTDAILVTLISSLISGLIGVAIAAWFFYRIERYKLRLDLARRLFGYRHSIVGDGFSTAMNEVFVVFAGEEDVIQNMGRLYSAIETPGKPNLDIVFSDFLKSVAKSAGLGKSKLNDAYFIKTFNAKN